MDTNQILNEMNFENGIKLDEMPELDLYMDQVIQLFEGKLSTLKRNDDEKILTKTMINNYAKGKLLLPIKNKKYSKEHLILMAFIYNLKGALSINDIKSSLSEIIESDESIDYPLRELYNCYLEESKDDVNRFKEDVSQKINKIESTISNEDKLSIDYHNKFLLLCSMVNMSNMYRRMSENIIDEFFNESEGK